MNYETRECDTPHLRPYPDCYPECDHDKCIGIGLKPILVGMTLGEAIEILEFFHDQCVTPLTNPGLNAVRMGIEALKRIKAVRIFPNTSADEFLPGETE